MKWNGVGDCSISVWDMVLLWDYWNGPLTGMTTVTGIGHISCWTVSCLLLLFVHPARGGSGESPDHHQV